MIKDKKFKFNKYKVPALLIVLIVLATAGSVFLVNRESDQTNMPLPVSSEPTDENYINFNPPTEEDKQEAEQNKKELADKSAPAPVPPTNTANLVITYAGQYDETIEIAAYVSNVLEDNGTCKLTLSNDSIEIYKEVSGFRDARHTVCPAFIIPRSELPNAGRWSAVVSYRSPTVSGESETKVIEVK